MDTSGATNTTDFLETIYYILYGVFSEPNFLREQLGNYKANFYETNTKIIIALFCQIFLEDLRRYC